MRNVTAQRLFDLESVLEGRHLIDVNVGPSLEPVLLSGLDKPNGFRVHREAGLGWETLDLAPTRESYNFARPLPGGRWLLVRSTAATEQDHNAHVYLPNGFPLASFYAGDAIEDVQTTEQGRAWISCFDEGIFRGSPLGGAD
jgi:hypothetical protein